ncbi:AraC family transcriptional regulator [Actinoplanes sp. TRM 88003]|uniref:AraC family transcriptional regulator n=1 Tax=Paractinoplanes aksuensis TaxID=2939490 RepID=A0ABT1DXC9_9ACTN|nr:AraC family transcriptional regulator [Actinoplanes aksuensis]MCO8275519.1 AraC family transcriptional regulator [Actinoplanes aksuensis]
MSETDPLSAALTTHGGRCGITGGFTAGDGPWAVRFRGGKRLPVIVRGPGWLIADGAAPERLEAEGLTLPSGRVPFVLASDPAVEPRCADRLLGDRPGLLVPLGGEQVVGLIRQPGNGPDERILDALPSVVRVRDAPAVRHPLDRIVHELSRRGPGFAHVTEQYAQVLMVDVLRSVLGSPGLADAGWLRLYADAELRPALILIHDRPAHPWRLADLARSVSMSRSKFIRRFQSLSGEPPLAYLHQWRMRLARTALRDTDAPIAAVAVETGFSSPSSFSHAFTRFTGLSPSRYRASHR